MTEAVAIQPQAEAGRRDPIMGILEAAPLSLTPGL